MVLLQNTLASELEAMALVDTEAEGIDNFANAFETYFYDATVTGLSINPLSLTNSTNALKGAMTGISSGGADSLIQAAITAFWTQMAIDFALIWTTIPPLISITPPPTLSAIGGTLTGVFESNKENDLSLQDAAATIAGAIHPNQLGGLAVLGPPPPGGVPTPIL
jgi:hypothetical protein